MHHFWAALGMAPYAGPVLARVRDGEVTTVLWERTIRLPFKTVPMVMATGNEAHLSILYRGRQTHAAAKDGHGGAEQWICPRADAPNIPSDRLLSREIRLQKVRRLI